MKREFLVLGYDDDVWVEYEYRLLFFLPVSGGDDIHEVVIDEFWVSSAEV